MGHPYSGVTARFGIVGVDRFECGERFIGHVPVAQDFIDDAGRKAGRYQSPHYARGLLFVRWLLDAFALQVLARQGFFIGCTVARLESFFNEIGLYALQFQVLAHTARAQLFIFLPQPRVGFGECGIVQIAMFLEARNYGVDDGIATLARLHAHLHKPAQTNLSAHVAAQRLDGVVVEARLVEKSARPALEGQLLASSS